MPIDYSVRSGHVRQRRGVTTVEFALTLPIALLLLFGALEFFRLYMICNSAANAAYEGARRAILPGATAAQAQAAAQEVLNCSTVRSAVVEVEPATIEPQTATVTVTVEVPGDQNSWIPPVFFAGQSIQRECSLSREGTR